MRGCRPSYSKGTPKERVLCEGASLSAGRGLASAAVRVRGRGRVRVRVRVKVGVRVGVRVRVRVRVRVMVRARVGVRVGSGFGFTVHEVRVVLGGHDECGACLEVGVGAGVGLANGRACAHR